MKSNLRITIGAVLGLAAAGALSTGASAATLYVDQDLGADQIGAFVNTCVGNTPCKTIGHALETQSASGDTIKVYPGTYLESDLEIMDEITIEGDDPDNPPIIDAQGQGRIFYVEAPGAVEIRNVTMLNGNAGSGNGGSINVVGGSLKLVDSSISNSTAAEGGAISCTEACEKLTVKRSTLENNTADAYGGAIASDAPVVVKKSLLEGNSSRGGIGGAVYVDGLVPATGEIEIYNSQLTGNVATSGGALFVSFGNATVTKSSFVANEADNAVAGAGLGSAVYFSGTGYLLEMVNSTITGNTASLGGAVYMSNNSLGNWANLAFVDNYSQGDGRDIRVNSSTVELSNSYFYNELAGFGLTDSCYLLNANQITGENNLWEVPAAGLACYDTDSFAGELTPDSLRTLGRHGGFTESFLLKASSNALGAGVNDCPHPTTGIPLAEDQRGVARPQGFVCDIGPTEQGVDFDFDFDLPDFPGDTPGEF